VPNNREWALFIWLGAALLWILSRRDLRSSLGGVLKVAIHPKILILLGAMGIWVGMELSWGTRSNLWTTSLTTDTMLWLFTSGMLLLGNYEDAAERGFVRRVAFQTLGVTALIQTYVNAVVMPLALELLLQPVAFVLGALGVLSARSADYKTARRPIALLTGLVGVGLLVFVSATLVATWGSANKNELLREAGLPIWLTIGFIPFVYAFAVFAGYEAAFVRIDMARSPSRSRRGPKLALLFGLGVNARLIRQFVGRWPYRLTSASSFSSRRRLLRNFKQERRG